LTVNFQNTSTGADDTKFIWDFGDSTSATVKNPQHTYNKFGFFPVTLIGSSSIGCNDTLTKKDFIKIQKAVISFSNLPQRGCLPYSVSPVASINSVDNVTSYRWDFGDGFTSTSPTPSHTYTKRGNYTVTLTVTTSTGCTETLSLPDGVKVGTVPTADFIADQIDVCASQPIQFTDKSTPPAEVNEWSWEFGDGTKSTEQNPLHQFVDTGWMDVKLIATNSGCPSQPIIKQRIVHIKPPIARFDYRPDCSSRAQYSFTDKSIGAQTWEWDFGDGSPKVMGQSPPVHTFPGLGSYDVKLTVTNGSCSFTLTRNIRILDKTPGFTASPTEGCKPFQPTLTPSSPEAGSIKEWIWDFGNGQPLTSGAPVAPLYTKIGYYDVTLTSVDTFGCRDIISKAKYIRVNGPAAAFASSPSQGCKGFTANFSDQSATDSIHKVVSWKWDFGDSTTSTLQNPAHKYDTIGNFNVKLIVRDAAGCVDSTSVSNFVKVSVLKAGWDVARQTCPNSPLGFSNSTSGIYTSVWDFGDGTTSTINVPQHAYTDTGFFTIKLKVQDSIGCQDSLVRLRYVQVGKPVANFTANNFVSYCTPFQAKFTNTSTYYSSSTWDLSIGTSRQNDPTSLYYTSTGIYDIKLWITGPGGCQDSITKQLKIYNPEDGRISYSPLAGCIPQKVSLEAFSEMNGSFVWDFGDGNIVDTTVNKVEHNYTDFGHFLPRIILREPSGLCIVPLTGVDTILLSGAKAKFKIDKQFFCDSGYVHISDSTTFNDPVTYNWDFGDGVTSSNPMDTIHFYANPGIYSVFLTVKTQKGCVDSLRTAPIKIVQSPLISINGDSIICALERSRAIGVMLRPDTSAVRWLWRFPNGNTASTQLPANQVYTKGGNFVITAIATNSSGCADTATKDILIHPAPVITVPSVLTMQAGFPVTIPATYSTGIVSYLWYPDSTLSCKDCPQPVAHPKFNTNYTVTATDSNACKNTEEVQVIVICKNANVFVPNTFSPNGDGSNDVFYVRGKGIDRVKTFRIFNRWGEIVFEKIDFPVNDPSSGWDGRFKGANAKPDVYVYQIEVFCDNNQLIHFEGNVALIQ
jgi:gliding motility-associated-like protein